MGKLEDIEARLGRLEQVDSPSHRPIPPAVFHPNTHLVSEEEVNALAAEWQATVERFLHERDQAQAECNLTTKRLVKERDKALASVQMLRADSERFFEEKHELTRKLSAVLAVVQRELPDVKWDMGDNATAVGEAIYSLKNKMRDAEERARTSLRLWQEFGRKLDEKYPGRDKGEAPDDYALRLLARFVSDKDEASHR